MIEFIEPQRILPQGLRILTTLRGGGVSQSPYNSLNLGNHVGDNPKDVEKNRLRLGQELKLPTQPFWLSQCHGNHIVKAHLGPVPVADGSWTEDSLQVLGILTADCLPVVLWNHENKRIVALHGGWKGLGSGILSRGIEIMNCSSSAIEAWVGPGISLEAYEVGPDFRETLLRSHPQLISQFQPGKGDRLHFDLPGAAKVLLDQEGVGKVQLSGLCTYSNREKFFSYRREGETGRMATLVWWEGIRNLL